MKVVKFETSQDRELGIKEIKLLITLAHPFLTLLNDLYTTNDGKTINILLTYCDGGDLSKMIKNEIRAQERGGKVDSHRKIFNPTTFLRWFAMSLMGLQYLHENNIMHRDIKPENLLISHASMNMRIGDFGLAKVSSSPPSPPRFLLLLITFTALPFSFSIISFSFFITPSLIIIF